MRLRKLVVVGAILFLPWTLEAQDVAVSGTVADATDAVLPGVTVTATLTDTGTTSIGVTDALGHYAITALRSGRYSIKVELPGFSSVVRDNISLQVGQHAVLDFKMSMASVLETITVNADAPLVDLTQSKVGGNIDQRQMQDLPINGRNWMELTLLAPGSRINAVAGFGESPFGTSAGSFQLNVDGQQVSNMMACARWGQPKYSKDAIQEFEMVTSRFDATQGRSTNVQVNAVTKAGTNRFGGTTSGYFRSDKFNSPDFLTGKVLPYSDQQFSSTYGGPIVKDKLHFFGYYDGERNPLSITYTSLYPSFNNVLDDFSFKKTDHKLGGRVDNQFSSSSRLMIRSNGWKSTTPGSMNAGGATEHPSRYTTSARKSAQLFGSFTHVFGSRAVNELRPGFSMTKSGDTSHVLSPQISLRGYTIGNVSYQPLFLTEKSFTVRDDFTTHFGRHQLKLGGEYLEHKNQLFWPSNKYGILTANLVAPPANLESLFPVWDDPKTWNLTPLSAIAVSWTQSVSNANYTINDPQHDIAAWIQDDWQALPRLTLNLGARWDVLLGSLGENINFPPFRTPQPHEFKDVSPRLGFAYELTPKTVLRGGWGIYYQGMTDQPSHHSRIDLITVNTTIFNDGRPDFASNPFNGPAPTFEQALALAGTRSITGVLLSPTAHTPYTYQTSLGMQRQLGNDMSFKADWVYTADRNALAVRNINQTYNPATGAPYILTDVAHRQYPGWTNINMRFTDGASNYHGLETAFTKRMSHHWQASATYTLSGVWNLDVLPLSPGCQYPNTAPGVCNVPITLAPDFAQGTFYLAGDQRHRAVLNAIWDAPFHIQASGLWIYGDNGYSTTSPGVDVRKIQIVTRLRPDGTITPRNNFKNDAANRVDIRLQRAFRFNSRVTVDLLAEAFNVFNTLNVTTFSLNEAVANFGRPSVVNNPRIVQLGFRATF
jgi:carboxypeptidase family protein